MAKKATEINKKWKKVLTVIENYVNLEMYHKG